MINQILNITVILSPLIFGALFAFLYSAGFSAEFKKDPGSAIPFAVRLAQSWARGWWYLMLPVLVWLGFVLLFAFLAGADSGMGDALYKYLFFLGLTALILAPGVNAAVQVRTHYPDISHQSLRFISLVWAVTVPLSMCLFSPLFLEYSAHDIRFGLIESIYVVAIVFWLSVMIGKSIGKWVTTNQLPDEPSA